MSDKKLLEAAEEIISHELGVSIVKHSDCESCLLYNELYIEVKALEYTDEQESLYFDISQPSSKRVSDIYIFSVKNESDWDFYIVNTSVVDTTFDNQSTISLSMVEPIASHVKAEGIKKSIDLFVEIASS